MTDPATHAGTTAPTPTPGGSTRRRSTPGPLAPPPDLSLPPPWSARGVRADDDTVAQVARWMAEPHVAQHWQQAWTVDEWRAEVEAQRGDDHSRPWLVAHHGGPVAYVEVYRPAADVLARSIATHSHDLGIHLAVGDPERVGRGVGSAVLRVVGRALLDAEPACTRVIGDPDAGHDAARGAFAKAGYHLVDEVDLPHKRAAVMALDRIDKEDDRP